MSDVSQTIKRPKLDASSSEGEASTSSSGIYVCPFTLIPLEILAEVLSYTTSPQDILALARCNKHFCSILANNPGTDYVWKRARQRCLPPIPDPTIHFTEASYAALIFDKGTCEACGKPCLLYYASFAIKARICNSVSCIDTWVHEHAISLDSVPVRYLSIVKWLPHTERNAIGYPDSWTRNSLFYRLADYLRAVDEINKAKIKDSTWKAYVTAKEKLAPKLNLHMQQADTLHKWRLARQQSLYRNKRNNIHECKFIARNEGWRWGDLEKAESFSELVRIRNICNERITREDIGRIRPQLEADIITVRQNQERRTEKINLNKRRQDVEKHYALVCAAYPSRLLPTLPEFMKLPTTQLMLTNSTPLGSSVLRTTHHSAIVELMDNDLKKWENEVREKFCEILGYKGWRSASTKKLHPTQRWDGRFRCKRCDEKYPEGGWDDRGLTLVGACSHVCRGLTKMERLNGVWSAELFVPDLKAIQAVRQVMKQLKIDPEDAESTDIIKNYTGCIQCLSCPVPILMTFPMMLAHCRRHEDPQFVALSHEEGILLGKRSMCFDTRKQVMENWKEKRNVKMISCRYCFLGCFFPGFGTEWDPYRGRYQVKGRPRPGEKEPSMQVEMDQADEKGEVSQSGSRVQDMFIDVDELVAYSGERDNYWHRKNKNKNPEIGRPRIVKYTFDGMRSHLKSKHGILWLGDEDVIQGDDYLAYFDIPR